MATIKGSNAALTHAQMDANFNEVTTATANIATLQTQLTALQAELDANQQSAENITTGVISRIQATNIILAAEKVTLLAYKPTGDPTLDTLIDSLVSAIDDSITDNNAQITLLGEDFTI